MEKDIVARLREFMDNEAKSCSMDFGCITPEYVHYRVPYAHYQYYGDGFNHTTDYHPLATERWDKVAMQTELDSFMEGVKRILEQRAREIYG